MESAESTTDASAIAAEVFPRPPFSPGLHVQVLLAEDNAVNQELVKIMLEFLGCRVDAVANGKEAVEAFRRSTYDLIFMDCQMPEMDGFEAVRRIREQETAAGNPLHTPIVAITAHALPSDRQCCLDAGMDDYLSKPFRQEQLREIVERWLERKTAAATRKDGLSAEPRPPDADTAPPPESDSLLDGRALEAIRSLERQGSAEVMKKVIEIYFRETPLLLRTLREAAGRTDAVTLQRIAHSLKSGSANLGARRLAELCRKLETAARSGDLAEAQQHVAEIEVEFGKVMPALAEEMYKKGS